MRNTFRPQFMLCMAVLLGVANELLAMAGTDLIAKADEQIPQWRADLHRWPDGVLDLVNDPLRTIAWHSWFSECPNDVDCFAFMLGGPHDVNHLIAQFGKIDSDCLTIVLAPGSGPVDPFLTGKPLPVASFALGDQRILDAWFERLPQIEPGVRAFGVHRYDKPPTPMAPTLTIYVDNEHVDLTMLDLPDHIRVEAQAKWLWRAEKEEWDAPPEHVTRFVSLHQARREALSGESPQGEGNTPK